LRKERAQDQSPRGAAAAELAAGKAKMLRLQVAERERSLMPVEEHEHILDTAVGITLGMNGLATRIFPIAGDLPARRRAERIVLECRREIASRCLKHAEALKAAEAQANGQDEATDA